MSSTTFERIAQDESRPQGIVSRRLIFCTYLQGNFTTDELAPNCESCGRFFVLCCNHRKTIGRICHHYRIAFIDGACLGNGRDDATAGIGVALGKLELYNDQWAIPVQDSMDPNHPKRTSQRTELLAAIEGLKKLELAESSTEGDRYRHSQPEDPKARSEWVIATDSEYVVKGITEWFPA
ncbi:hypothetical protein D9615_010522 [Tricholomella constricta]|uniref:RNase H type-1 domain-containing protein n=1 Tax=Tricholomella constricta TaxID=117010 RepID=A0A8H5GNK7_9AGAR|nr:hypothetical protein D9615_010522 [Tricholomella constricta]